MLSFLRRLFPVFIELWLASILLAFFVIRMLGSQMGQRFFALVRHWFAQ